MSSALEVTDKLFFDRPDATLDRDAAHRLTAQGLANSDDGELFLEYRESEAISLDDGRIRSASFDTTLGFGLRAVAGEATGYAHSGELTEDALARAATNVAAVTTGHAGTMAEPPDGPVSSPASLASCRNSRAFAWSLATRSGCRCRSRRAPSDAPAAAGGRPTE